MIHEMILIALHVQKTRHSARLQVEHFVFPYGTQTTSFSESTSNLRSLRNRTDLPIPCKSASVQNHS